MKIDNNFIQLISHKDTLNKEQFKILGLDFQAIDNWKNLALEKEVSKNDANLLMLLKGDLALKAQEQIIKNYHMILEFNNIKPKTVYEIPKDEFEKFDLKSSVLKVNWEGIKINHFFAKPKDLKLQKPHIEIKIINDFMIEISSDVLAKDVFLSSENQVFFEDNYFDLLPNEKRIIKLSKAVKNIKVKSLFDTMK